MPIFLIRYLISIYLLGTHPFYVGITEINYNKNIDNLEITLRLFTDDFENALRNRSGLNILLSNEEALQKYSPLIESYIKEKLRVSFSDKAGEIIFLGSEIDDEAIWSYLEVKNIHGASDIIIRNEIFFELFDTQMHLIHFNIAGKKKSYQLNRKNPEAKFTR
ncbi:MAG: hypothetical protein JJU28_20815 [Cyclobacteriaceae bacterium]|nr:hypothetical protein [Cyclobacteriaceae bacterium]